MDLFLNKPAEAPQRQYIRLFVNTGHKQFIATVDRTQQNLEVQIASSFVYTQRENPDNEELQQFQVKNIKQNGYLVVIPKQMQIGHVLDDQTFITCEIIEPKKKSQVKIEQTEGSKRKNKHLKEQNKLIENLPDISPPKTLLQQHEDKQTNKQSSNNQNQKQSNQQTEDKKQLTKKQQKQQNKNKQAIEEEKTKQQILNAPEFIQIENPKDIKEIQIKETKETKENQINKDQKNQIQEEIKQHESSSFKDNKEQTEGQGKKETREAINQNKDKSKEQKETLQNYEIIMGQQQKDASKKEKSSYQAQSQIQQKQQENQQTKVLLQQKQDLEEDNNFGAKKYPKINQPNEDQIYNQQQQNLDKAKQDKQAQNAQQQKQNEIEKQKQTKQNKQQQQHQQQQQQLVNQQNQKQQYQTIQQKQNQQIKKVNKVIKTGYDSDENSDDQQQLKVKVVQNQKQIKKNDKKQSIDFDNNLFENC